MPTSNLAAPTTTLTLVRLMNWRHSKSVQQDLTELIAPEAGKRFGAFGSLDRATRGWHYLPNVQRSCGQTPNGEALVFAANSTSLEIGQGLSGFRGYVWPPEFDTKTPNFAIFGMAPQQNQQLSGAILKFL
jgi:hypothetical protein